MFNKIREYASPVVILLSTIVVIGFNTIASVLPLNNQYTNAISDKYATSFTPLGYVFSIWGIIYVLLSLFALWTFAKYKYKGEFIRSITLMHVLATVFNIAWLICWHYDYILVSMVPMVLLLGMLISIYNQTEVHGVNGIGKSTFSIYLSWISVATIANAAIVLNKLGWDGFGLSHLTWTSILLTAATLLAYFFLTKFNDKLFYIVITWAAIGIWFKNPDDIYIFAIVFVNIMIFAIRPFIMYLRNPQNNVKN